MQISVIALSARTQLWKSPLSGLSEAKPQRSTGRSFSTVSDGPFRISSKASKFSGLEDKLELGVRIGMFTGPPDSSKLLERLELAVRFPRMEMLVRLLLRPREKLDELLELLARWTMLATWLLESPELVNWRLLVLASWPSRKSCCPSGATNCPSSAKLADGIHPVYSANVTLSKKYFHPPIQIVIFLQQLSAPR